MTQKKGKKNFFCSHCRFQFQAAGQREKWQSPLYGPCWREVASCPRCGQRAYLKEEKLNSSNQTSAPEASSCAAGSCCGGSCGVF